VFGEECAKTMVDQATIESSIYYSDWKWLKIKSIIFRDGEKQKGRFSFRIDGTELMIIAFIIS
jgi:hypothetical protein